MALTYVAFKNKIELLLQDSANANFAAADLDDPISDACREAGGFVPHVPRVSFTIESRFGVASSTSAGNLVDATKSQFVAGDVGKDVYNTTDKTWARIKTFTSTTTVALSKDIMASNDNYEIYNAGCTEDNQVSISDIDDYLDIERVEYPVGTSRSWEIDGKVLTIKKTFIPDSRALTSGSNQPDTEVIVWFKKRHLISQLTDLAAAVNNAAGYVAGDTSMAINELQASGTIEAGQEFTLADTRGTYTVTADATIAANAATISFFPALESSVADNVVITFTGSTMTPTLEPIVAELAAGLAAVSKTMNLYKHVFDAVTAVALTTTAVALVAARITQAVTDVASGRTAANLMDEAIVLANAEFDLMNPEVDEAETRLDSALTLANTIPVGGGAMEYLNIAAGDIGNASGYFSVGRAYLMEAASDGANAAALLRVAAGELQAGTTRIQEADASLRKAAIELRMSDNGRNIEAWGRNMIAEARAKLSRLVPRKYLTSHVYTRA